MRNLLALLGAAIVLFAGLGWYFKWYTFAMEPGSNGKQRINLEVDTHKIVDDAKRFENTVETTVEKAREKAPEVSKPADQPANTPAQPADQPAKGNGVIQPPAIQIPNRN